MKAVDIEWDVDCQEDLEDLPTEIKIPEGLEDEEDISDYISDVTGFCHKGFRLVENEKDKIVLDFGNIVSELETKNLKLLKVKDNNGLFVVDREGNLYGIESYYNGGYLDRFIGEKFVISFERMEQPTRDFEDWRKEFMDASWVKSFIERIVKKEYPNFKDSIVEDEQIPPCKFNIGDKVKIPYISDCDKHNGEVGEVTWIHAYKFYPGDNINNHVWKHQIQITYADGQTIMADPDRKSSGIVSEVILVEAKSPSLSLNTDYSDYHKYDSMSSVELKAERDELQSAISNERLWQKGCDVPDDIWMHEQNIVSLVQELEYVNKKIKELSMPEHQQSNLSSLDSQILSASTRAAESRPEAQMNAKEPEPEI